MCPRRTAGGIYIVCLFVVVVAGTENCNLRPVIYTVIPIPYQPGISVAPLILQNCQFQVCCRRCCCCCCCCLCVSFFPFLSLPFLDLFSSFFFFLFLSSSFFALSSSPSFVQYQSKTKQLGRTRLLIGHLFPLRDLFFFSVSLARFF